MADGFGARDHVMDGNPPRSIEDARIAKARTLVPIAKALFEMAKAQADSIDGVERRFGSENIQHLARVLDDLWMAADGLVTDYGTEG